MFPQTQGDMERGALLRFLTLSPAYSLLLRVMARALAFPARGAHLPIVVKTCAYCGHVNEVASVECHECHSSLGELPQASRAVERALSFVPRKPGDSDHDWVTLLRCRSLIEADLIAMELRGAEIPVFIPDEYLMQAIAWNVSTYGWVRVQVRPSDYEDAQEVLGAVPEPAPSDARKPSDSKEGAPLGLPGAAWGLT